MGGGHRRSALASISPSRYRASYAYARRRHVDAFTTTTYGDYADPAALVGDMSMGFYITRAAWNDPQRREAALSLLEALTADDLLPQLGGQRADDALGESIQALLAGAAKLCKPVGERMTPEAHAALFAGIPGVASGARDAAALLQEIADMGGFVIEN